MTTTDGAADPEQPAEPLRFVGYVFDDVPLAAAPYTPVTFDGDLFDQLLAIYDDRRTMYKPLNEFKLTQEQLDELLALTPASDETPVPPDPAARLFGVPVRLVATFPESTIYQLRRDRYIAELREKASEQGPIEFIFDTFGPFKTEDWWSR